MQNHPIRVLLIEDNLAHARAIGEGLCANLHDRFDLTCTDRLATGLEVMGKGRIDLVLLDLNLPDSAGLATFERLQRSSPQTPVVIMTGVDDPTLGQHAVAAGARDVLVKGQIEPSLLARVIQHIVEKQRMEAASRSATRSYGSVFDHALEAMLLVDDEGRCLAANSAASALLARSLQQLRGLGLQDVLMLGEDYPGVWSRWRKQGHLSGSAQFVNGDGRVGDVEFSVTPDCIGGCHLIIVRDVTGRKRSEEKLRSCCEQWRVLSQHQHDLQLSHFRRIREASEALAQASRRIDGVAKSRGATGESMQTALTKLSVLIQEASSQLGSVSLKEATAQLGAIEALRSQAFDFQKRTGIQCQLSCEIHEKGRGETSATRLCPILEQALSNVAIQGTATSVEVRLWRESGRLVMEIQDNGQTLSESQLTDAHSFRLSGVREQVLRFGGDLTLQGLPGRGTTLRLWLPSEARRSSRKQP